MMTMNQLPDEVNRTRNANWWVYQTRLKGLGLFSEGFRLRWRRWWCASSPQEEDGRFRRGIIIWRRRGRGRNSSTRAVSIWRGPSQSCTWPHSPKTDKFNIITTSSNHPSSCTRLTRWQSVPRCNSISPFNLHRPGTRVSSRQRRRNSRNLASSLRWSVEPICISTRNKRSCQTAQVYPTLWLVFGWWTHCTTDAYAVWVCTHPFLYFISKSIFSKEVYRSKKVPHCVRLSTDPVAYIDLLKRTTQLVFGANRPGLEVKVGQMASGNDLLLDNLQCLVEGLDLHLPRGALNIKQLKLRSQSSRAYHLYGECSLLIVECKTHEHCSRIHHWWSPTQPCR